MQVWLDDNELHSNIPQMLAEGIDSSEVFICFITEDYLVKVAGRGPNRERDNCKKEFEYAERRKGANKMLAVVLESACRDQTSWHGPVGVTLGQHMYVDLTEEQLQPGKIDALALEIEAKRQSTSPSRIARQLSLSARPNLEHIRQQPVQHI